MDYDEDDYEMMPHDRLLALADRDRLAAEAFYYRYQHDDDPVLQAEAHKVLKFLAEEFEASCPELNASFGSKRKFIR